MDTCTSLIFTPVSNSSEETLGNRVVLILSDHLQHKNHQIYCDNFFTSQVFSRSSLKGVPMHVVLYGKIAKALKVHCKGENVGAKLGLVNRGDTTARQQLARDHR